MSLWNFAKREDAMDLFEVDKSRAAVTMETARSAPQSAIQKTIS